MRRFDGAATNLESITRLKESEEGKQVQSSWRSGKKCLKIRRVPARHLNGGTKEIREERKKVE